MTTRRPYTPSDLKFLLSERAVLSGLIRSAARDCQPLEAEAARLEAKAQALRDGVAGVAAQQAKWQAAIAAIDQVLGASHPGVAPGLAGTVSAWAGKYGRRGELKAFIHSTIRATPTGVATGALVDAVIIRFQLALPNSEARSRLRHVISKQLHESKVQGLLHAVRANKGGLPTRWFWNTGVTGAELLQLATEAHRDETAHSLRGEVGG